MTIEEELRTKLESIRESVTATKFATEALLSRVNRIESDINDADGRVDQLSEKSIRIDETMKTILKSMSDMGTDLRAIRNSVLSTIMGASFIWLVGTAVTTFYSRNEMQRMNEKTPATISKNA